MCARGNDRLTDYMCAIEVDSFDDLPPELDCMSIPERRYAIFRHEGTMAALRETWQSIWTERVPQAGLKVATPPDFERYGEGFDPASGEGVIEIWIPIQPTGSAGPR